MELFFVLLRINGTVLIYSLFKPNLLISSRNLISNLHGTYGTDGTDAYVSGQASQSAVPGSNDYNKAMKSRPQLVFYRLILLDLL